MSKSTNWLSLTEPGWRTSGLSLQTHPHNSSAVTSSLSHPSKGPKEGGGGEGGRVIPYGLYRYVRLQRVGFSAVLDINRVSILLILAILVYSSLELVEKLLFHHY